MQSRKKAQDVFNESNFVFSQKVNFEEAFPDIDSIRIEVKESGRGTYGDGFRYETAKEYVNCSNPICYGGGFSLGNLIRKMVSNNEESFESHELCKGYEGSPKGAKRYRSCFNSFKVRIYLKYKISKENTGDNKG